jgi:hypothetical protein
MMAEKTRQNLCVTLVLLLLALITAGGAAFLYRGLLELREELLGFSAAWCEADETARREAAERDDRLLELITSCQTETAGRLAILLRNQEKLKDWPAALPGPSAGPAAPSPEQDYPLYRLREELGELYRKCAYTECMAAAGEFLAVYPLDAEARFYRGAALMRLNPADSEALPAAKRDLQLALEQLPGDSRIPPLLNEIALEEGARKEADEP